MILVGMAPHKAYWNLNFKPFNNYQCFRNLAKTASITEIIETKIMLIFIP